MGKASSQKWKKRLQAVESALSARGPNTQSLWYESNLFWSLLSLVGAIILTVVAAMVKDLRWLLWLAWIIAWVPLWIISHNLIKSSSEVFKFASFFIAACVSGGLFYFLSNTLARYQDVPSGFLQIANIVPTKEYSSIAIGRKFAINIFSTNPGPGRVFNAAGFTRFHIVEVTETSDRDTRNLFEKDRQDFEKSYHAGEASTRQVIGVNDGIWTTQWTEPLSQQQVEGFMSGKIRFYWVSWVGWESQQGRPDSLYDCRWLQPLKAGIYTEHDMVWHFC